MILNPCVTLSRKPYRELATSSGPFSCGPFICVWSFLFGAEVDCFTFTRKLIIFFAWIYAELWLHWPLCWSVQLSGQSDAVWGLKKCGSGSGSGSRGSNCSAGFVACPWTPLTPSLTLTVTVAAAIVCIVFPCAALPVFTFRVAS